MMFMRVGFSIFKV